MAEADTLTSLSPKELGRHLREVRRRKGLSLSEVARGAGLTRLELNAYEKGRVPIPESDLFVIAGSCGVEVSEMRAPRPTPELAAADPATTPQDEPEAAPAAPPPVPSTIEDTVAQLRRSQEVAAPSAPAVTGRRRPRALGAGDAPPPPPSEPPDHEWSIEHIDPLEAVRWPSEASIASPAAYGEPSPAEPIDVFEELARLGDPVPFPPNEVEDASLAPESASFEPEDWPAFVDDARVADEPVVVEMAAPENVEVSVSAADAPPIDVAARVETYASPWDTLRSDTRTPAWGETFTTAADSGDVSFAEHSLAEREDTEWSHAEAESWGAPDDTYTTFGDDSRFDTHEEPAYDWGATADDGVDASIDAWATAEVDAETAADAWDTAAWPVPAESTEAFDPRFAAVVPWPETETTVDPELVAPFAYESTIGESATAEQLSRAPVPWAHEPDPEATSTGFYIDWGDANDALVAGPDPALADYDPEPEAMTARNEPEPTATARTEPEREPSWDEPLPEAEPEPLTTWLDIEPDTEPDTDHQPDTWEPAILWDEPEAEPAHAPAPIESVEDLPVISWRPQWEDAPLAPAAEAVGVALALDEAPAAWAEPEPESGPEPEPDERYVVAGAEWELGNAVPLVEVRSTGSLVMRRADERWALADVTAATNFALEAYVDLRGGPGFGVLFRADVDADGRMSGYSFDIDPVYEGGSYLVREWRADRELWNPIAHVPARDPEAMHGLLAVRVTVDDERLVASVNGTPVLSVENLKEASAERGRDGPAGNRVGIQAWSSTDLVIDELRIAEH